MMQYWLRFFLLATFRDHDSLSSLANDRARTIAPSGTPPRNNPAQITGTRGSWAPADHGHRNVPGGAKSPA
ncbi:hypothetical protein RBSH_01550 [Rhodopirellula baltica SH28]|uniref:Uncharacterized protein n=1 Tax=Rhodopirellula baltica SH28 TaxID=993517 RepID=K5CGX9_RHOBT|nr:hypothetical protein RBSH_01550 [Rhodopirellula baltica SH28]